MPADVAPVPDNGLILLLPAAPGEGWRWWRVEQGALGDERVFHSDEAAPWGDLAAGAPVTVLVPTALAPVRGKALPAMPVAQALAAERLGGASDGLGGAARHVAVAAANGRLLSSAVAAADMDLWLAECAATGLDPQVLIPAALVLPRPDAGLVTGELAGQPLARTADAAFAGEPALVEALAGSGAGTGGVVTLTDAEMAEMLLAAHRAPPLNLRQGAYAPRRVSFFRLPDWAQLARMAATATLLALALMLVWIVKWNADASARESEALALVQKRFPAATDLDSAERLVGAELARRGEGGTGFPAPTAALLAAMRPVPSIKLRDLGYAADGTLRFTAAAPRTEDVNAVLLALQRDGWKITVPPALAPDPTGATVAAITLRAP